MLDTTVVYPTHGERQKKACIETLSALIRRRYFTTFLAVAAVSPATRWSREGEAVFTSTPTELTQSSTTLPRAS